MKWPMLLLCVMAGGERPSPPPPPPESPPASVTDRIGTIDSGWVMSQRELEQSMKLGSEGNATAALRVALHFTSQLVDQKDQSRRWMQIAAENGEPSAQYNLWFDMKDSESVFERARALFWLRKSASAGNALAQEQLRLLEPSSASGRKD